jgi:hypothetical protein
MPSASSACLVSELVDTHIAVEYLGNSSLDIVESRRGVDDAVSVLSIGVRFKRRWIGVMNRIYSCLYVSRGSGSYDLPLH